MNRARRTFSAQQKAEVVRRHLTGHEAVSDLADELQVQPSQIHGWVNQVLQRAEAAFDRPTNNRRSDEAKDRRIERLEAKLVTKNEVISELLEENVRAKKAIGEL
jgi:transposase-like protein